MKIERLNVGNVGVRYWGTQSGNVFALLPSPVDSDACLEKAGFTRFADSDLAWDEDFAHLTSNIVGALRRRYGEGELVAPRRVVQIPLWKRFKGLLVGYDPADLLNPAGLSAVEALLDAARDDSHLDFASVRFVERDRGHRCNAMIWTAEGHPIVWVWLAAEETDATRSEIVREVAADLPHEERLLPWDQLMPTKPRLSIDLPRARIHRGDCASWTDGERVLGFNAGLCVAPHEVYLPPDSEWAATAPTWAVDLRPMIANDFATLGMQVVEHPGARVSDETDRDGVA